MKTTHDKVIVKLDESLAFEDKNGLYVPKLPHETVTAKVIAAGPGRLLNDGTRGEMSVRDGSKIVIRKHSAQEIQIEGEKYHILSEVDIIVVLEY